MFVLFDVFHHCVCEHPQRSLHFARCLYVCQGNITRLTLDLLITHGMGAALFYISTNPCLIIYHPIHWPDSRHTPCDNVRFMPTSNLRSSIMTVLGPHTITLMTFDLWRQWLSVCKGNFIMVEIDGETYICTQLPVINRCPTTHVLMCLSTIQHELKQCMQLTANGGEVAANNVVGHVLILYLQCVSIWLNNIHRYNIPV